MIIITHEDIKELAISNTNCLEWLLEGLDFKKNCYLPAKCSIKPTTDIFYTSMPCFIPDLDIYGLKMVSRLPAQNPALNSTIMLYQASTGNLLAIIDCNWITAVRTGAVATLSILKAAKTDFQSIGCVGLGNTCEATLDILLANVERRSIQVKLKSYKNSQERIIERYKSYDNISFEVLDNMETLIEESDVLISSVTSTKGNFGEDTWFKPGITVIPIHTMGFQNCDLFFDKVIIDDYDHVKNFKYFNKFKKTIELETLPHVDTIRANDQERIIAYNVGIALHDVYFAYKIFTLLKKQKSHFELNQIHNRYWF